MLLLFVFVPICACVDNSLWVASATCTNCTNSSVEYVCFDWSTVINNGLLTDNWYTEGEVLNTTVNITNEGYCYDNLNTSQLCSTNTTFTDDWTFNLFSIDTNGTTFSSCGFTPPSVYTRQINISNRNDTIPMKINYTVNVTFDTQSLITLNKMESDCSDLKIYWRNDTELDRVITSCNETNTTIEFTYMRNPRSKKPSRIMVP